jgi:glycosyltransferase involved in cell wall biosynthesis
VKILLGVHQFFPHYDAGTERYVLNLARQLMVTGHRVHVLTYDFAREAQQTLPGGRMLIKEYSYEGIPVTAIAHKDFPDFTFDMVNDDFAEATRQVLETHDFDVYHCAHPLRIGGSMRASAQLGLPTVLMLTDYWLQCPVGIMLRTDNTQCSGPDGGIKCVRHCFSNRDQADFDARTAAAQELVSHADRILSPSMFLIGVFQYSGFLPAGRVALSRHGFDYSLLTGNQHRQLNPERITIAYIGTVQYHKGVLTLVEAFSKVTAANVQLDVWGGCFHETDYDNQVRRIGGRDPRIRFRGEYNYNDLEMVLESTDVVVVPSLWYENAPLTITSSHAMGVPVITSAVGGMAEMVQDGVNGLTFTPGDADSLAAALARIAEDPSLVEQFRAAIVPPARLEEEAFRMERLYAGLVRERS